VSEFVHDFIDLKWLSLLVRKLPLIN